jgi:putative restriction endonuclease
MLSAATLTRLEKAAVDNGFDCELPADGAWVSYASTQAPLRVWLTAESDTRFLAALSQTNVARALTSLGEPTAVPLPLGAFAALAVVDVPALHQVLRRAFQLSKTLPDELLRAFRQKTATLPRTTEIERLVVQRVGQDVFRAGLLDYWEGRCAITGLAVPELLRASHIKPWASCDTDAERLDVFNGLLLAPQLDAVFDCGLITVQDDGTVTVSRALPLQERGSLSLEKDMRVRSLAEAHRGYLEWHRGRIFRG